jgi:hypothetical protein
MALTRDGTCDSGHGGDETVLTALVTGIPTIPVKTFRMNALSGMDTGCPENAAGGPRSEFIVAGLKSAKELDIWTVSHIASCSLGGSRMHY